MRILFTTTRGQGHLLPLLPYARALVAQGHEVRIAGPENHAAALEEAGLTHLVTDRPAEGVLEPIWARARGLDPDPALALYIEEVFAGALPDAALPGLLAAIEVWQPDLLVRESLEYCGLLAAEIAGVPHIRVEVHNAVFEERLCLPHAVPAIDARRAAHGLAPAGLDGFRREPVFTAFPAGLDGSADRGDQLVFRVNAQPPFTPPEGRRDWLPTDGTPLIYVTFGTAALQMDVARGIHARALAAVADLPARVLMTTGGPIDDDTLGPVPDNARVEGFVPQTEVLGHATLVVSHGGSGTTLGALAAGLPQVVVPLFADQPDNAALVAASGLGLAVAESNAEAMRAAIKAALADPSLRSRAAATAAEMADLPNVATGAAAMLQHCSPAPR